MRVDGCGQQVLQRPLSCRLARCTLKNDQLLDITGERMVLVHDTPVRGEPHDFVIFKREWLNPKQVYDNG